MPKYARLLTCTSASGGFSEKKDTEKLNAALRYLQERGATIIDIKIAAQSGGAIAAASTIYTIIYDAPMPIE